MANMWTVFIILATSPLACFMYLFMAVSIIVAVILTIRNQRRHPRR